MTNAERMINHIQLRLAQKQYTVLNWELTMFDKMLKTLPCYETDMAYNIICADDEAPEIEDQAMYRTFDSGKFHLGDEVRYGCVDKKGIVIYVGKDSIAVLESDNYISTYDLRDILWKRTGRNFPAIENILNILKNSEVNNA